MIRAEFFRSSEGFSGFSISGHAGMSVAGEADVVCAAVSSAVQLTANGLTEICGETVSLKVEENQICLIKENESLSDSGRCFLEALFLHLQLLSEESPDAITIILTEV